MDKLEQNLQYIYADRIVSKSKPFRQDEENASDISYSNIIYTTNNKSILSDVSFSVLRGHCCSLVGHNGAGKTTLIKILLGIINSYQGQVILCGTDMKSNASKKARQHIGFVPEVVTFKNTLTAFDYLLYVCKLKSVDKKYILQQAKLLQIDYALDKKIGVFSKGMKQRLALVQAMLGNPRVLILDEPASGLDPETRKILYSSLRNYTNSGNSVLFSSHSLNDIEQYIDKFIILDKGKVIYEQFTADYQHNQNLLWSIEFTLAMSDDSDNHNGLLNSLKAITENIKISKNQSYIVQVKMKNKLSVIKQLSNNEQVTNIKIVEPSLENIYSDILLSKNS